MGGIHAEGVDTFIEQLSLCKVLELTWIIFKSEENFEKTVSKLIQLKSIKKVSLSMELNKVKKEKMIEGLTLLVTRMRANKIVVVLTNQKLTKNQLDKLGDELMDRESKKNITVNFTQGSFHYVEKMIDIRVY